MLKMVYPHDEMAWGTAATQDATTYFHIDADGFLTIVIIMAGAKYWVIGYPKRNRTSDSSIGDIGSINALGPADRPYITSDVGDDIWDHEGVLLLPGDTLYVKFMLGSSHVQNLILSKGI
jgi:hypothetical protein